MACTEKICEPYGGNWNGTDCNCSMWAEGWCCTGSFNLFFAFFAPLCTSLTLSPRYYNASHRRQGLSRRLVLVPNHCGLCLPNVDAHVGLGFVQPQTAQQGAYSHVLHVNLDLRRYVLPLIAIMTH